MDELEVVTLLRLNIAVQVWIELLVALSFENIFVKLTRITVKAYRLLEVCLVWVWEAFLLQLSNVFAIIMVGAKV